MTVFRSNNEPDPMPAAVEQIRTGVQEAPQQPPTAQPFADSEQSLAAAVNELRDKSQEYARLNTEQAELRDEDAALKQSQAQALDDKHTLGLLAKATELQAAIQARIPDGAIVT